MCNSYKLMASTQKKFFTRPCIAKDFYRYARHDSQSTARHNKDYYNLQIFIIFSRHQVSYHIIS